MEVKQLYEVKRVANEHVCAFCGKPVSQTALEVRKKLLERFPYFGVLLCEIKRNRGSDVFCDDHLMVLVKQVFAVKVKGKRKQLVLHRLKVRRLAQRLYWIRISTLVRRDAIDRLYERSQQRKKQDVPEKISLEEFVELFEKSVTPRQMSVDITIDDMIRMLQKPQRRRQPCWMNPPKGECVYKDSCSHADICGGSAFAAFIPSEVKRPKHVQLTHEFYWDWEPCELNCPDCSPDCPYVKRLELKVRKVEAKPKRWKRKQRKWPNRNWRFLGRDGKPFTSHWLIDDDYIVYETDAGGAPRE